MIIAHAIKACEGLSSVERDGDMCVIDCRRRDRYEPQRRVQLSASRALLAIF
jgi:hypothetical protein